MSKRRVYIGLILSYLIVFLLPLFINLFSLTEIAEDTQKRICESVQVNLEHVRDSMDDDFREIDDIVANLTSNSTIYYIATQMTISSKNVEYSKIKQAQEYIQALQVQTLVEEYYVYFHQPEMIISSGHVFLDEVSSRYLFQYNGIEADEWLMQMEETYNQYFYPEAMTLQNSSRQEMFLYVQSLITGTGNKGTFVFPIRSESIREQMEDYYIPDAGWAYIMDAEGKVIVSIPSDGGEFIPVSDELLSGKGGISEIELDGRQMELIYSVSDEVGLRYVAVIPRQYISSEVRIAMLRQIGMMGIVLFVGLCCISVLSWRRGRKITEIIQMIFNTDGGTGGKGEPSGHYDAMEYISESVRSLIDRNLKLKEDVKRQEPVTRNLLLERLLLGGVPRERMNQDLEKYGIIHGEASMLLFLFSIRESGGAELEAEESTVYKQLLDNDLQEMFSQRKYLCTMEMNTSSMILVLDRAYENLRTDITERLNGLYKKYQENYGMNLRIAVSSPCAEWNDISKAYDQVCELMEYGASQEKNILFYEEYRDRKDYYYFPVTLEERLINAVKTGNTGATHEQLRQVYTMNVLERDLSPSMMHFLVNNLQCTIFKILHGLGTNVEVDEKELNRRLDALSKEKELLSRFQQINRIFGLLSERVAEANQEGKSQIIKEIKEYIEANHADQSMSLTKIAENFGYASTYFSRIFKEQFGMNFTSYLENVRIDHVCTLLKTTDMTLEKIAGETGYNSAYVLRTAFKRLKGITPNEFRKQSRGGEK